MERNGSSTRADRDVLLGVALVCFANLLLEVLVTRIFSATMFYHFTFMAVGLAMFGIAASGVYVFVNESRFADDVRGHMATAARRFAITAVLALVYTLANPIFVHGDAPRFSGHFVWQMLLLVGFTATPFFYAGVVVSLALTFFRENVERVYFFDLAGAAIAAITVSVILGLVGGPSAELVAAIAALVGASFFDRRRGWVWPALGVAALILNLALPLVRVGAVKWDTRVNFEKWNAFSRITVDPNNMIRIDAAAATPIVSLKDLKADLYKPEISAVALATFDQPPEHALVIGPGGGRDVLFALSRGAKKVTGVEINPIIANDIMRGAYQDASGGLYTDPRVEIVVDEGRSYVRRSDEKFDLIQASQVDTWAATGAGAFALTENTLYTVEAFEDYFEHLTDRGVVTMMRSYWAGDIDDPKAPGFASETDRLVLLAAGALEELGVPVDQTRKHLFLCGGTTETHATLVAKRTELTPAEVDRLAADCTGLTGKVLLSPSTDGKSLLERMVDAGAWSDLVEGEHQVMTPPTDDRPFFFFSGRVSGLFHPTPQFWDPNLWMSILLSAMLLLSAVFVVAPLAIRLVRDGVPSREEPRGLQVLVLATFGLVGFSFMAIEIALMQRFSLFLGHPSYSLVVILSVVLLSTAAGSFLSGRIATSRLARGVLFAGAGVALLAVVYGLVLGGVLRALITQPLFLRIAITALLVAPCGLLMGAMIPSLARVLGAAKSPLVPWGWGVNGATSVIGTALSTTIAIYAGFTVTFLVGAVGYAIAALLGARAAAGYAARSR
jgi:hypothetical protein